jgi:hypothetical protein
MFMWVLPSPWLDIATPCSADENTGKALDRAAEGVVHAETGLKGPFHQRYEDLACVGSHVTPPRRPLGSAETSFDPSTPSRGSEWQDRRTILV